MPVSGKEGPEKFSSMTVEMIRAKCTEAEADMALAQVDSDKSSSLAALRKFREKLDEKLKAKEKQLCDVISDCVLDCKGREEEQMYYMGDELQALVCAGAYEDEKKKLEKAITYL